MSQAKTNSAGPVAARSDSSAKPNADATRASPQVVLSALRPQWQGDLLVLTCVFLVFARALGNDFVNWDDGMYVYANPMVIDPGSFTWLQRLETANLGYAVPVVTWIHGWLFYLGSGQPWVFHLLSVVLHAVNATWLLRLLRREGAPETAAVFAALAFALHPIVVEPVAWSTGLKDLLFAFFALGVLATRHRGIWPLIFVGLALASKPAAVLLAVPLIVAWLAEGEGDARARAGRRNAAVGALVMGVGVVYYTATHETDALRTSTQGPFELWRFLGALGLCVKHLLVPASLSPRYALASVSAAEVTFAALALLGFLYAAVRSIKDINTALVWWSLAAAAYLPVSNLRPLFRFTADSYVYVPWMAICAALAVQLGPHYERWIQTRESALTRLVPWALRLVLVLWAGLSFLQVGVWTDSVTLWREAVEATPESGENVAWYGEQLGIAGDLQAELALYLEHQEALERDAKIPAALLAHYQREGDLDQAARLYERAFSTFASQDSGVYWHYVEFVAVAPDRHSAKLDAALFHAFGVWLSSPEHATRDPEHLAQLEALARRRAMPDAAQALAALRGGDKSLRLVLPSPPP